MQIHQTVNETTGGMIAGALTALATLFVGADFAGLVQGLFAAMLTTFFIGSVDSHVKAFAGVLLGSLLAGFGGPVAANIILGAMPGIANVMDSLKPLASIGIGGATPALVPPMIEALKRRLNSYYGSK